MDSGFFDEDNLVALDRLNVGFICTGVGGNKKDTRISRGGSLAESVK
jgi:hypothetical protein